MTKLVSMLVFAALVVGCAGPTPMLRDEHHPANPKAAPGPSAVSMPLAEDETAPPATSESQPNGGHNHAR